MTRIVFARNDAFTIFLHTDLNIIHAGSIWMEAWATPADLATFDSRGWWYDNA